MASPADGPPMFAVLMLTLRGQRVAVPVFERRRRATSGRGRPRPNTRPIDTPLGTALVVTVDVGPGVVRQVALRGDRDPLQMQGECRPGSEAVHVRNELAARVDHRRRSRRRRDRRRARRARDAGEDASTPVTTAPVLVARDRPTEGAKRDDLGRLLGVAHLEVALRTELALWERPAPRAGRPRRTGRGTASARSATARRSGTARRRR